MTSEHFVFDTEQRRLELAVLKLCCEVYQHQTDILNGRTPAPVEVLPEPRLRHAMRELALYHGSLIHMEADIDQELDSLDSAQSSPVPQMVWVTRTMNDVRTGDRIRLRGSEAVVDSAYRNGWHVHPASRYEVIPLEHTDVMIRLEGRDKPYVFRPDIEVDIHLTTDEAQYFDDAGWEHRVCVITKDTPATTVIKPNAAS